MIDFDFEKQFMPEQAKSVISNLKFPQKDSLENKKNLFYFLAWKMFLFDISVT